MAKLSALSDAFTAPTLNTTLWNSITGTATLDTVNDLVGLAVPTVSGTTNQLGTTSIWDATGSSLSAQITVGANGNGGVTTALRISLNTNNSIAMRVAAGVFGAVLTTAGTPAVTPLPSYDPNVHRWWRISEAAGQFVCAASPDGLNWTTLATLAYTWSATAVTVAFQAAATVTEVTGNAATIQHINTPLGGLSNPNWPRMEYGWGARWNANSGGTPMDRYVDQSTLTSGTTSVSRGRQYELDQIRAGEMSATLTNAGGALDPTNTAGPYYGHILPFQPYRLRAQWPPTRNLLSQLAALGGDGTTPGPVTGADVQGLTGASISVVASATAWMGSNVLQFAISSGAASGLFAAYTWAPPAPGRQYSATMRVRNVTPSTTLQVAAELGWFDAAGNLLSTVVGTAATLTGSATAAWTTITITGTAPANTAEVAQGAVLAASPAAACSLQVDGWQWETGTASAFQAPGVWNPVYSGFVERWPSQWTMSGTYGTVQPTVTDLFSLLSQRQLDDALTEEINSHNPRFLYRLDDPAGSTSANDSTGSCLPLLVTNGKYGASSIAFGADITATDPVGGIYTGSGGTVAQLNNPSPGQNIYGPCTYLSLTAAGITGPANPTGAWTRAIAFRYTGPTPTYSADLWMAADNRRNPDGSLAGANLILSINSAGHLVVNMGGPASGTILDPTGVSVVDGNWHMAMVTYDPVAVTLTFRLDSVAYAFGAFSAAWLPTGLTMESVGAFVDNQIKFTSANFAGNVSFVAEFPVAFSGADRDNLYTAWKSSCAGDSTNARYARILRYADFVGTSSIQTGLTTSMGPANISGQDAVTALQGVVDTEGGAHYVARDGSVTFKSRAARYDAFTPTFIFGENASAGEWPYEDCQFDFDSTHLGNMVTVTQDSTGQTFNAQDAASIAAYFPRTLTRSVNSSSPFECQDAANYLLSRYRQPATRVSTLKLHPSGNPAMWPVCLALELGARVRVVRRPPGAPATTIECFVENIQWDIDDANEAVVTLQCSPADLNPYAVFASWHTTLRVATSIGATSITVNASVDTTNPLAAQLGRGQNLVLGQNSANQETVTVDSVGATSPGWTSAVITLTAATTKAHVIGDLINEPLPAGVTDPTTYDASSKFDSVVFAY